MDRMISVYSNVLDGYNANEVVGEIENSLQDFDMPDGITYEFTGEQEQQAEDMEFLGNAFIIAVFLIFIILVTQFNWIISPFIIILSGVFSTIGAFLGYAMTGKDVRLMFPGVGVISVAGSVVS